MRWTMTLAVLLALPLLLWGCTPQAPPVDDDDDAGDDDNGDDDAADDDAADDDAADDDAADDDASDDDSGDCSGYRDNYPSGPYGVQINSVLDDFPGMVDGQGNTRTLFEIFQDTSKIVLVVVNAFDS